MNTTSWRLHTWMLLGFIMILDTSYADALRPRSEQRLISVRQTQSLLMDQLDDLLKQRLKLMDEVAQVKWNTQAAIEDETREQTLLRNASAQGAEAGLPTDWVKHFFRMQIEAGKQVQYGLYAKWASREQPAFSNVKDLSTELRPELDQITAQLVTVLSQLWPDISTTRKAKFCASKQPTKAKALARLPLCDGSAQAAAPRARMRTLR